MFSYFTIATANEKLPIVVDKFKNIVKLKNEIVKIEHELNSALTPTSTFEQYVTIKQKLNSAVTNSIKPLKTLKIQVL